MITAIAIDDEPPALRVIETFCKGFDFITLQKTFTRTDEALRYLRKYPADLLFLDIQMPSLSGIELYRTLEQPMAVIFTTAYSEYAVEGFNLNATDYLLKPLSAERFERCMTRVQDFFRLRKMVMNIDNQHGDTEYIMVKQGYERYRLHHTDILYLEAMKDYTKIITRSGQHILVLETLSSMIRQLPGDKFMRTHRSYAVNREHINAVSHNRISILGQEIPVGKSFKHIISSWHNGYS